MLKGSYRVISVVLTYGNLNNISDLLICLFKEVLSC